MHPDGWARVGAGVQVADASSTPAAPSRAGAAVRLVHRRRRRRLHDRRRRSARWPARTAWRRDRVRALRGRHRRRRAAPGHARPAPRPVLGPARRQGRARHRHRARVRPRRAGRPCYGGALYFDGADAAAVLHALAHLVRRAAGAGDDVGRAAAAAAAAGRPAPLAGRLTVAVRYVWTGAVAEGERQLQPLRAVATALLDGGRRAAVRGASTPCTPTPSTRCRSHEDGRPAAGAARRGRRRAARRRRARLGLAAGHRRAAPARRGGRPRAGRSRARCATATRRTSCTSSACPSARTGTRSSRTARRSALRWRPGPPAGCCPTSPPAAVRSGSRARTTPRRSPGSPSWPSATTRDHVLRVGQVPPR